MSLIGKVFTAEDLGEAQRKAMSQEEIDAWCNSQTERYRIVAYDSKQTGIIAEELDQRAINCCGSPRVRRVLGMMLSMSEEERLQVTGHFGADGVLLYPSFTLVK